jgi:hypothetical protein
MQAHVAPPPCSRQLGQIALSYANAIARRSGEGETVYHT